MVMQFCLCALFYSVCSAQFYRSVFVCSPVCCTVLIENLLQPYSACLSFSFQFGLESTSYINIRSPDAWLFVSSTKCFSIDPSVSHSTNAVYMNRLNGSHQANCCLDWMAFCVVRKQASLACELRGMAQMA